MAQSHLVWDMLKNIDDFINLKECCLYFESLILS
jgi:hypothetical protein